jgi:hypothetical protein
MKIDESKLKNVVRKPDGEIVAQCPACAKAGGDTTGNHLIVYPDGRFGCVVHEGDKKHKKEIWKLVGCDDGKPMDRPKVKIRPHKVASSTIVNVVPRLTLEELGLKREEMGILRPIR